MNTRAIFWLLNCLFNNEAKASETEHNGKTDYID